MSLLDRLLGKRNDPTLGWGGFRLPIPEFDLKEMRFGALRFGDDFAAAEFLGRPDRFRWTQDEYCELLYPTGGFQIDYDHNRFAYLAFFIGPDDHLPKHRALKFSKPRLLGCKLEGIALSRDTDRTLLDKLFGAAEAVDTEPQEVVLFYSRQEVTLEFEMDGKSGRLKRWNLYPK